MKTEDFLVVVIDDKKIICDRIGAKLAGANRVVFGDKAISISVKTVHVRVKRENKSDKPETDTWTFSEEMLSELAEAASRKPDLLILDYIYIDDSLASYFKARAKETEVQNAEIQSRALTPLDLMEWVRFTPELDNSARQSIISNLFDFTGPLYLHTYTPQGLYAVTGTITDRARKTSIAFPKASINSIDTHAELFNNDEFDWPNQSSKYDKNYYPYQLAVFFDQVAHREIVRKELDRNRYLRVRRTTKAVSVISAIGAAVGFAAGWIGTVVLELIRGSRWVEGIVVGLSFMLVLVLAGFFMPLAFERMMRELLEDKN